MDLKDSVIILPGYIDEDYSENICIICQNSNNVNKYLCSRENNDTQNCIGSLLHEKCLENWIKNKNTFELKCLNCNSNKIIIPDNVKKRNELVDISNNDSHFVIINQYNIINSYRAHCCTTGLCIICMFVWAILCIILVISNLKKVNTN